MTKPVRSSEVVVLGGGVIGLAVAWRSAAAGLAVTVVDPDPTRGAWRTAAGMLAPAGELHTTERPLLALNTLSAALWRQFAADLEQESGRGTGYLECGSVVAAWDGADLAALRDQHVLAGELGVRTELLTGRELRQLEPALAAGLPGGLHAPDDHQVDPRLLHDALTTACRSRGVRFVTSTGAVVTDDDRVSGVRLANGELLRADQVVVTAGAWAGQVEGVPRAPVRPVKGQTLRLRLRGRSKIAHVVRGDVAGSSVYVVPRADGRLVVGASSEEVGYDTEPRAGAVYELLRDAQALLPELDDAVFEEVSTGLRPGSPDNAPVIGPGDVEGLVWATGHHRNGVLLAPVTAHAVAELLTGVAPTIDLDRFQPQRFVPA